MAFLSEKGTMLHLTDEIEMGTLGTFPGVRFSQRWTGRSRRKTRRRKTKRRQRRRRRRRRAADRHRWPSSKVTGSSSGSALQARILSERDDAHGWSSHQLLLAASCSRRRSSSSRSSLEQRSSLKAAACHPPSTPAASSGVVMISPSQFLSTSNLSNIMNNPRFIHRHLTSSLS